MAKKEESVKSEESVKKIRVEGPVSPENGASILRFGRDGRKKPLDLYIGQVLTVGENEDITEDEASRLMAYGSWSIKEVME